MCAWKQETDKTYITVFLSILKNVQSFLTGDITDFNGMPLFSDFRKGKKV